MADHDPTTLEELLARLEFYLRQPLDFTRTDTQTTLAKVRLLTAAAGYFNILAVSEYGGRLGPSRDPRLVEQVIAAAFQSFGGEDPHPQAFDKAAMLLRGITQGHPFSDGNKRTGFLVASYYLSLVGIAPAEELPRESIIRLCQRISAGELRDVEEIAGELRRLWQTPEGSGS